MAESLSTTGFVNVADDSLTKETKAEIINFLDLDDVKEKDQIVNDLLENGRQSLQKYKSYLIPDVYSSAINEKDNQLMTSLKKYFEQQWKSKYKSYDWFISFLQQYENDEEYQCILSQTAEYGKKFLKDPPYLFIVLRLLFDGIGDKCPDSQKEFDGLWSTLTINGLSSARNYKKYISENLLDEIIKKEEPVLFKALCQFHKEKSSILLSDSGIKDKKQLYDNLLASVAEHGWLNGLQNYRNLITPINFDELLKKIPYCQEQPISTVNASNQIQTSNPKPTNTSPSTPIPTIPLGNVTYDDKEKRQLHLEDLRHDLIDMPRCAEKSITQLLVYFEEKLIGNPMFPTDDKEGISMLENLKNELNEQEYFSEKIQRNLQDLERYVRSSDVLETVRSLGELMMKIRPLYVQEIQRLVEKAKDAGRLIDNKEIVLLLGQTGTGKSTTIQFLAGSKMKKTKIEIEPGKYLDHIGVDGLVTNPELKNVTSSARNKSETRYIAPVTIQLRDILGPYERGEIILCDAPGFDDTAGPEVDIANGVGVIEAIKKCQSVKILALSSYKSLGDRGQGIQKLAHLLINMVNGIEKRLGAILYAFTKYPEELDICALLTDIKISKVNTDPLLVNDNAFVSVLTNMIEKTKEGAEKIDPIQGDRKSIIKKLKEETDSILYPEKAFHFLLSEGTQARMTNQAQIDKSNINCALKHKNIDLVVFYLKRLKTLKDLIKHSATEENYKNAISIIIESITGYYNGVKESFNRSFISLDGLKQENIIEYQDCVKYVQSVNKLNEYLESELMTPESLMQNIFSELRKRSDFLEKEDLHSQFIGIYLNNVCLLKNTFREFEPFYNTTCASFRKRISDLAKSCSLEPIAKDEFDETADIISQIWKCSPIFDDHLHNFVKETYKNIVQSLLHHFHKISEKSDSIQGKFRLKENDIKTIRDCIQILSLAKENVALQDRVSKYIELLGEKNIATINDLYNGLIERIVACFKRVNDRITEMIDKNEDRAVEYVEMLINDIDAIRTIPEIESKTSGDYYRTVGRISDLMRQYERDVETLLSNTENQSGTPNYARIARLVSRLKNAKWMNCISPEAYDITINRVTDELILYSQDLKQSLTTLNISFAKPDDALKAVQIFYNVESLSVLEPSVPQLKQYKDEMVQYFLECIQKGFDRLQKLLNLQNREENVKKQELKVHEEIKREYENLHPANIFLQRHEYSNVDELAKKIEQLEENNNTQSENNDEQVLYNSSSLSALKLIKEQYDSLLAKPDSIPEQIDYLKSKGIESIEWLDEKIKTLIREAIEEKRRNLEKQKNNIQTYYLSYSDASTVDKALLFTSNCEAIANNRIKEMSLDVYDTLNKYIRNYHDFLDHQITRLFNELTSSTYQDLEVYVGQLFSFSKFPNIFKCIEGEHKEDQWRDKFNRQCGDMSTLMESSKISGHTQTLKEQLDIAQVLMCLDRFLVTPDVPDSQNKFAALFRKYRVELTTDTANACATVLKCISEGEYAKIGMKLADIDQNTLSPRDVNSIKYSLQNYLNDLIQNSRMIVNSLDLKIDYKTLNERKIKEITGNIDKIRTIQGQSNVMQFVSESTKSELELFEKSIKEQLINLFLREITSIKIFISYNDIAEAEQSIENVDRVQSELTNYFVMESVSAEFNNVKNQLKDLPNNIIPDNYFENVENFCTKPPKTLLLKLEAAAKLNPNKYTDILTNAKHDTCRCFEDAIKAAQTAEIEKRSEKMLILQHIIRFLPKDLEEKFTGEINKLIQKFNEENEEYQQNLKEFRETVVADDSAIEKIGQVARDFQSKKQHDLFRLLSTDVINKLSNLWKNVQDALDKKDVHCTIDNLKQIIKYKEYIDNIPEVDKSYKKICTLISKSFNESIDVYNDILKIENIEIVNQTFSYMVAYIELSETFPQRKQELVSDELFEKAKNALKKLSDCWQNISKTFDDGLARFNIKSLVNITNTMKRSNGFLTQMKNCASRHALIVQFVSDMKDVKLYAEMIDKLKQTTRNLKENFNIELCTEETKLFEVKRNELFQKLAGSLKVLKSFHLEFQDILIIDAEIKQIENGFREKVEKIKEKLLQIASEERHTLLDSDYFRNYYNHLLTINKCMSLPEAKIQETLELAEKKIFEKVLSLSTDIANAGSNVVQVTELLKRMKFFAENFSMFDTKINGIIDAILKTFKTQYGAMIVSQLTIELEKSDLGARIIAEHSCLSGEDWRKRREKMQNQDNIDYVINNLEGDNIAKDELRTRFRRFREKYDELVGQFLSSFDPKTSAEPNLEVLISETKRLVGDMVKNSKETIWSGYLQDRLPKLLAHIFALWTLKNTQHYNTMRGIEAAEAYLLMPHAAQVIAIFRILGIGYEMNRTFMGHRIPLTKRISNDLLNNLAQIGTGEGKSVVLAITACVFALLEVDVNCSCYSEYLSTRDKTDFASLFQALGIEQHIEYGTFNKLCENLLNEQFNIREKVSEMITNNKKVVDLVQTAANCRLKVLLIDEVDVFLSEKFYGGMYTPSVYIKDPKIKALLDVLWQNRSSQRRSTFKNIIEKVSEQYRACAARFSNWTFLLDEAIKDMVSALQTFQSTTYIVQNDKIVYVEGESIVENVVYGYDTIWAYYFENEKGFISSKSLENHVGMIIHCGTFSYAQLPLNFAYITGVTGTLKTLAEPEKQILKDVYQIEQNTYMPSVFGVSNRNYNSINDVQAVDVSEYYVRIRGEIHDMSKAKRAILVFFESEEKLMTFYNSSELSNIKSEVQIITEKVSVKERELCIKRAATDGKVTLLTRTFGRGTDFICRNQQVLANGGIHVLQTFFSEELSEEYQIMGRGARQGDRGSYRMILLNSDLEWVLGADWKHVLPEIMGSILYTKLNKARNTLYEGKCAAKEIGIEQRKREHQSSISFIEALNKRDIKIVQTFLKEQNLGANIDSIVSRTLLLMDATNSMSNLLSAAKDTVSVMFERTSAILHEKNMDTDIFSMQFAIYRNYNSRDNKILEVSPWESKGNNLRAFLNRIGPEGGYGNEAIEIALWHAVKESETTESISQVILIGDAAANTKDDVHEKRKVFGENYWKTTRFDKKTYYEDQLKKLIDKNIPVHTFYLTNSAKHNFREIAKKTNGRSEFLDIFSSNGAELLTHFVTEEVLRKLAGDSAVELYRLRYGHRTFTS